MYKKPSRFAEADEETQVHTTLLEYGRRYGASRSFKSEKETSQLSKDSSTEVDGLVKVASSAEDIEREESRIKILMEGMSQTDLQQVWLLATCSYIYIYIYIYVIMYMQLHYFLVKLHFFKFKIYLCAVIDMVFNNLSLSPSN